MSLIVQKKYIEDQKNEEDYILFIMPEKKLNQDLIIKRDTNGLYIIENQHMTKGAKVMWNKNYWLRHLTTNKYLKVGNAPFHDIDENVIS